MTTRATGPFAVKLNPLQAYDNSEGSPMSRMSIDKEFTGDLQATSKGEMLATNVRDKGSGVYVAIERVTGTLGGRTGTFVLHHTGIMTRGTPQLTIKVAPDSGTGELTGITGNMAIVIEAGKHSYEFDYAIPE